MNEKVIGANSVTKYVRTAHRPNAGVVKSTKVVKN